MDDIKKTEGTGQLTDNELESVQGGMRNPVATVAAETTNALRKLPQSIAQSDTISSDDNLPQASGGL